MTGEFLAMRRMGVLLASALALSGCIPAASEYGPRGDAAPRAPQPPDTYERRSLDQDVRALPAAKPTWELHRVTPDARQVKGFAYVVGVGDTLRAIAAKTGTGAEAIARANGLAASALVQPGQRLMIPGGRYHLVRAGDTGIAIARAYGVAWAQIVAANGLAEPYALRTGQRLLIPSGRPETIEERAARFHIDIDDILTGGEPALAANARPVRPATPRRPLPATAPLALPPAPAVGQFAWPVRGAIVRRFGAGTAGERSDGIKIAVPLDTPVAAAADGVVAYAGSDVPALGGLVIVKHGNNLVTVYGHAARLLVQRGQTVKKGQTIARSGRTGAADRPELHFEIRQGRTPVDPLARLPAR